MFHLYLARGIPDQLNYWYQLVTGLELNVAEYKGHGRFELQPKMSQEKRVLGRKPLGQPLWLLRDLPVMPHHVFSLQPGGISGSDVSSTDTQGGFCCPSSPEAKEVIEKREGEIAVVAQVIEVSPWRVKGKELQLRRNH